MADHNHCKYYENCDYRNDVGSCPNSCVQYKHKDAVIVVRCKDCKYWCEDTLSCTIGNHYDDNWYAEDFCSYGERKDNE